MTPLDLPPVWRRGIYAALALGFAALVVAGQVTAANTDAWLTVVATVLGVLAAVLAAVKARRPDVKALYAAGAALAGALVTVGVLQQSDVDNAVTLAGKVVAFFTLGLATARTDPSTPTGQPRHEYTPL